MAHQFLSDAENPATEVQSRCGPLTILTSANDLPGANIVRLEAVQPGTLHFHRETAEIYVIRDGFGFIRVDDVVQPVEQGDRIIIYPGALHQVFPLLASDPPLVIDVIAAPAWREDDEFVADDERILRPTEAQLRALHERRSAIEAETYHI